MSFGFSVGDIVLLINLTHSLISWVRNAPAQFKEFEGDLVLASRVLDRLRDKWSQFSGRATGSGTPLNQDQVLQNTIDGIRNGLEELQTQLASESVGPSLSSPFSNFRFTRRIQDLHRRLQFHLASIQLVMQNVTLMQGRDIAETLEVLREAQGEQEREDQELQDTPTRDRGEFSYHETSTLSREHMCPIVESGTRDSPKEHFRRLILVTISLRDGVEELPPISTTIHRSALECLETRMLTKTLRMTYYPL